MSVVIIILLIFLFGGFIITVILVYRKRKKFWGKVKDGGYYVEGPDAGDISLDHLHGSADHYPGDGGRDH